MFKVSVYFSRSSLGFPVMRKAAIVIVVNQGEMLEGRDRTISAHHTRDNRRIGTRFISRKSIVIPTKKQYVHNTYNFKSNSPISSYHFVWHKVDIFTSALSLIQDKRFLCECLSICANHLVCG